jgi:hypothetical protein
MAARLEGGKGNHVFSHGNNPKGVTRAESRAILVLNINVERETNKFQVKPNLVL